MFEIIVAWTYALYCFLFSIFCCSFFVSFLLFCLFCCIFVICCCVFGRTDMFFSKGSQQLFHHVLHQAGVEEMKELRLVWNHSVSRFLDDAVLKWCVYLRLSHRETTLIGRIARRTLWLMAHAVVLVCGEMVMELSVRRGLATVFGFVLGMRERCRMGQFTKRFHL
jgi:hypothetical protein